MSASPKRIDQNCSALALFNFQTCYDSQPPPAGPSTWGTNTKQDAYRWAVTGFKGQISVPVDGDLKAATDHRCDTYSTAAQTCPNARLETNINGISAGQMRTSLIQAIQAGPIDPLCNCHSVTKTVIFWKYGEQPASGNQIDTTTNIGSTWDDAIQSTDQSNALKRVIVDKVRQFRFNEQGIGPNYITGYFVGYYTPNGTSTGGTPNAIANTVKLVA
jgi:hypothetical protein